jgi:hypothetical protein
MYLDSNGDGIHTDADRMSEIGVPTPVNVYLDTRVNWDGTVAQCISDSWGEPLPLSIQSYVICLGVQGGEATFSAYQNAMTQFTSAGPAQNASPTTLQVGYWGGSLLPAGLYRLGSVVATVTSGSPRLEIVYNAGSNYSYFTGFGSECYGNNFDNFVAYEIDFFEAGNLDVPLGGNHWPTISAPGYLSIPEGQFISISATANDPDAGAILSLNASGAPQFLTPSPVQGQNPATMTLSGTPGFQDAKYYNFGWAASDGTLEVSTRTQLLVTNTDRTPIITSPNTIFVSASTMATFLVSAFDPDGQTVDLQATPYLPGAYLEDQGAGYWRYYWTPDATQVGDHLVVFGPSPGFPPSDSTLIRVVQGDAPPTVGAPLYASTTDSTRIAFNVTASDPDGDPISSLTAEGLPADATFSTAHDNSSAQLEWTPTVADLGIFPLSFRASNTLFGSANTLLYVNRYQPPRITIDGNPIGTEGQPLALQISALDPNAHSITSFGVTGAPPGAALVVGPDSSSASLSWTPGYSDAGQYAFHVTASNRVSASQTFYVVIQNFDRPPVVTAPDSVWVAASQFVSFEVTASDPDGEPVT